MVPTTDRGSLGAEPLAKLAALAGPTRKPARLFIPPLWRIAGADKAASASKANSETRALPAAPRLGFREHVPGPPSHFAIYGRMLIGTVNGRRRSFRQNSEGPSA